MSENIIEIKNINVSYGSNHVLKDINLNIKNKDFYTFLGPSGCGKTTLLRLIAGFEKSQSGELFIGGNEISHSNPWERDVGMVFQNYALWPHMTVYKNISFGLEEKKIQSSEIKKSSRGFRVSRFARFKQKIPLPIVWWTTTKGSTCQNISS